MPGMPDASCYRDSPKPATKSILRKPTRVGWSPSTVFPSRRGDLALDTTPRARSSEAEAPVASAEKRVRIESKSVDPDRGKVGAVLPVPSALRGGQRVETIAMKKAMEATKKKKNKKKSARWR